MKTMHPDSAGHQGRSNICLKPPGQEAGMLMAKWQKCLKMISLYMVKMGMVSSQNCPTDPHN
jgi:hypothetical protein